MTKGISQNARWCRWQLLQLGQETSSRMQLVTRQHAPASSMVQQRTIWLYTHHPGWHPCIAIGHTHQGQQKPLGGCLSLALTAKVYAALSWPCFKAMRCHFTDFVIESESILYAWLASTASGHAAGLRPGWRAAYTASAAAELPISPAQDFARSVAQRLQASGMPPNPYCIGQAMHGQSRKGALKKPDRCKAGSCLTPALVNACS